MIVVTNHAIKRARKRAGLPKRSVRRMAKIAYYRGTPHRNVKGDLKWYISRLYKDHRKCNNIRVYGNHIWLFRGKVLVTVLWIPNKYKSK